VNLPPQQVEVVGWGGAIGNLHDTGGLKQLKLQSA